MYAGVPTSATAFLTRDCHCVRTAVIRLTQKQVICHQWHVFCSGRGVRVPLTYVLPICSDAPQPGELFAYLRWLSAHVEVIIVDGSPAEVFDDHARRLTSAVRHMRPDPRLGDMLNQKVAGVLTGGRCATHPLVIIADDDVRYDERGLNAMAAALECADVVRPQNYFEPLPWHAWIDTGRTLLNRISGGDWPGTLGVRWPILSMAGGYDGNVLFENLELVRTVKAAGGLEHSAAGIYVRRLPPSAHHFWSQRVRQAYDEFARPLRLAAWLAVAPASFGLIRRRQWRVIAASSAAVAIAAEVGRRRAGEPASSGRWHRSRRHSGWRNAVFARGWLSWCTWCGEACPTAAGS